MWKEFKKFALKGNVVDLAVAVIIGAAFGKIVTSLVNDIVMPLIGLIIGGIDFTSLKIVLTPAVGDTAEVAILYGSFIQAVIDFFLIALSIFFMIKLMNKFKKKEEEQPAAPAAPPQDVVLLTEIRDLLKTK
ncbi:MAG TPA: large-conductance mechanosensitive channel protein MscL [Candidatus Limiplasma sp.]|nr:large-conductance mechanosensitive channel protein MscL [Candidatus Limiplasma sp.]